MSALGCTKASGALVGAPVCLHPSSTPMLALRGSLINPPNTSLMSASASRAWPPKVDPAMGFGRGQ